LRRGGRGTKLRGVEPFALVPFAGASDLPAIDAVRAAVRAQTPRAWMPGPDSLKNPNQLAYCRMVRVGTDVVGYSWAQWWTEWNGTRLLLLLGWIDPAHRRRGFGTALLRWQIATASATPPAELSGTGPLVLGGNADADQPDARDLLLAHGFRLAFTVVTLVCDLAATRPQARPMPHGFTMRPVTDADHPAIHAAIEESFARDAHAHVPRTFNEYLHDVREPQSDTGLWCVAWHGNEVAGVVINERRPDGTGLTPWVVVRQPYRRRGLAEAMLHTGLARCAAAGITHVEISTVLENVHHTVTLYERVGYRETARMPRYRRPPA
jgi:GNAT superfamily N-acetyltransferase